MDDPASIALEQYVYWRELGLSHEEMLRQLGVRVPWQGYISSAYVIQAIGQSWLVLQRRRAA